MLEFLMISAAITVGDLALIALGAYVVGRTTGETVDGEWLHMSVLVALTPILNVIVPTALAVLAAVGGAVYAGTVACSKMNAVGRSQRTGGEAT